MFVDISDFSYHECIVCKVKCITLKFEPKLFAFRNFENFSEESFLVGENFHIYETVAKLKLVSDILLAFNIKQGPLKGLHGF